MGEERRSVFHGGHLMRNDSGINDNINSQFVWDVNVVLRTCPTRVSISAAFYHCTFLSLLYINYHPRVNAVCCNECIAM